MDKTIGMIGCGNMGGAMLGGIIKSNIVSQNQIYVADLNEKALKETNEKYGVNTTTDNIELAKVSDIIILALKPDLYPIVINQIKNHVKDNVIVVTIAAGKDIKGTTEMFGKDIKVVRVMPNTPALVEIGRAHV